MRLPLLTLAILLSAGVALAQTSFSGRPSIIPPSPTAAALEKYGQVPVGTYTGVPAIGVPLYEIKVRDLTIPLSLSYHAGGFRVNEESSWVGLGWSLLAGGAITRTVRNLDDLSYFVNHYGLSPFNMPDRTSTAEGARDESPETFIGNGFNFGNVYSGVMGYRTSSQIVKVNGKFELVRDAVGDPTKDWEPDDFRFTAGTYSGQFAFKQDGSIHLIEQQKILIEPSLTSNKPLDSPWKITTPDGFQYFYSATETATSVDPNSLKQTIITAWYLTRIVSPLGEEAAFIYDQGTEVRNQPSLSQTEVKQYSGTCQPDAQTNQTDAFGLGYSSPRYLRRIDFRTGYVLLDREAGRLDLKGADRLSRVSVYDQQNRLLKQFNLQASYFEVPQGGGQAGYATTYATSVAADYRLDPSFENHRLRLDAVQEAGSDGLPKPATSFTYNDLPLPAKSSFSVDFWGYYNGKRNSTLVPAYAGQDLYGKYAEFTGADRTPDSTAMQAGILRKITYPTGGSTTYTFEPHYYGNLSTEDRIVATGKAVQLRYSNNDPGYTIMADTIKVKVATPITVRYDMTVRDPNPNNSTNKSETGLWLMDKATGRVYTSGSVANQDQYQAIYTFTEQERSNPSVQRTAGTATLLLPPGTYYFRVLSPGPYGAGCPVMITASAEYSSIEYLDESENVSKMAGGLRIRRVADFDGLDASRNRISTYQYGFRSPNAKGKNAFYSSGVIMSQPVFKRIVTYSLGAVRVGDGSVGTDNTLPCRSFQLISYSNRASAPNIRHFAVVAGGTHYRRPLVYACV